MLRSIDEIPFAHLLEWLPRGPMHARPVYLLETQRDDGPCAKRRG